MELRTLPIGIPQSITKEKGVTSQATVRGFIKPQDCKSAWREFRIAAVTPIPTAPVLSSLTSNQEIVPFFEWVVFLRTFA
jgi:hypothetical protein